MMKAMLRRREHKPARCLGDARQEKYYCLKKKGGPLESREGGERGREKGDGKKVRAKVSKEESPLPGPHREGNSPFTTATMQTCS